VDELRPYPLGLDACVCSKTGTCASTGWFEGLYGTWRPDLRANHKETAGNDLLGGFESAGFREAVFHHFPLRYAWLNRAMYAIEADFLLLGFCFS